MGTWAQSVVKQDVATLRNWDVVPLVEHPVDPGYYAVFARLMLAGSGGSTEWEHAGYAQLTLGTVRDETYGRLLVRESSGGDAVKGSTPVSLMVVSATSERGDRIELIARGSGALVVETRITIIALDEVREPVVYGEPPSTSTTPWRFL